MSKGSRSNHSAPFAGILEYHRATSMLRNLWNLSTGFRLVARRVIVGYWATQSPKSLATLSQLWARQTDLLM